MWMISFTWKMKVQKSYDPLINTLKSDGPPFSKSYAPLYSTAPQ